MSLEIYVVNSLYLSVCVHSLYLSVCVHRNHKQTFNYEELVVTGSLRFFEPCNA